MKLLIFLILFSAIPVWAWELDVSHQKMMVKIGTQDLKIKSINTDLFDEAHSFNFVLEPQDSKSFKEELEFKARSSQTGNPQAKFDYHQEVIKSITLTQRFDEKNLKEALFFLVGGYGQTYFFPASTDIGVHIDNYDGAAIINYSLSSDKLCELKIGNVELCADKKELAELVTASQPIEFKTQTDSGSLVFSLVGRKKIVLKILGEKIVQVVFPFNRQGLLDLFNTVDQLLSGDSQWKVKGSKEVYKLKDFSFSNNN